MAFSMPAARLSTAFVRRALQAVESVPRGEPVRPPRATGRAPPCRGARFFSRCEARHDDCRELRVSAGEFSRSTGVCHAADDRLRTLPWPRVHGSVPGPRSSFDGLPTAPNPRRHDRRGSPARVAVLEPQPFVGRGRADRRPSPVEFRCRRAAWCSAGVVALPTRRRPRKLHGISCPTAGLPTGHNLGDRSGRL